jgi:quinol monooxygenase YgiN
MSQVTNLAFFRARSGQNEALGAALAALVEPTRLEAGCLDSVIHPAALTFHLIFS